MCSANLSQSYFTNRLDRYIRVRNEAKLAGYFTRLIHTIASFSYMPNTAGELQLSAGMLVNRYSLKAHIMMHMCIYSCA